MVTRDSPTEGTSVHESGTAAKASRLAALAILKANWNEGRSYLDNFVPFVAEILRIAQSPMTVDEVQAALNDRFHILVPNHTLATILNRAVKQKLATKSNYRYIPNGAALASARIPELQHDLLRCHDVLVARLADFATTNYQRTLTSGDAERLLDAHVDAHSVPIALRTAPDMPFKPTVVPDPSDEYIISAFVDDLRSSDPNAFEFLLNVVKGSMLACALYLPDVAQAERRFRDSTAYLDTPVLLRALGYAGPALAAPVRELFDLLKALGVRLACFDHTVVEIRGALQGAAAWLHTSSRIPTEVAQHFTKLGYKKSDVELRIASLEKDLSSIGVAVLNTPPHEAALTTDEPQLQDVMRKEVRYSHDGQVTHDLECLTAIFRLRRGKTVHYLEESRAVFVTTNDAVVRAARQYFGGHTQGFTWPIAILDRDLATIAWLKSPLTAPDLPRKQVIADCFAALRPDGPLWNRYLDEAERLAEDGDIEANSIALMRYSPEAQRALMDATLGDPGEVSAETVHEVLDVARATARAPVEAELDAERDRRAAAQAEADRQRCAAESAKAGAAEAIRLVNERERERCRGRAARDARRLASTAYVALLSVVLGAGAIALLGTAFTTSWPPALKVAAWAVLAVGGVVAFAGAGWGFHLGRLRTRIQGALAPRLEQAYLAELGDGTERRSEEAS